MTLSNKFEIHYFLKDGSHSMDALVKNKCEAEFLAVAYEIINILDLDIILNAEALREGGIKDFFNFLIKETSYAEKIATLTLVLMLVQTTISLIPKANTKIANKQNEELMQLSIEEKKLNIQKLKNELSNDNVSEQTIESSKMVINKSPKIVTRRSNFYKTLLHNQEVAQLGFSILNKDYEPLGREVIVSSADFVSFVQRTNKLPVEIDEDARIEIVAPVLREGKAKWKGIYNEEPISFFMDDKIYKDGVLAKRISFKNGDVIICVLEIHKEINEVGEIVITKYSVQAVLDKGDNGNLIETSSGKQYRRAKKTQNSQRELFDPKPS